MRTLDLSIKKNPGSQPTFGPIDHKSVLQALYGGRHRDSNRANVSCRMSKPYVHQVHKDNPGSLCGQAWHFHDFRFCINSCDTP